LWVSGGSTGRSNQRISHLLILKDEDDMKKLTVFLCGMFLVVGAMGAANATVIWDTDSIETVLTHGTAPHLFGFFHHSFWWNLVAVYIFRGSLGDFPILAKFALEIASRG